MNLTKRFCSLSYHGWKPIKYWANERKIRMPDDNFQQALFVGFAIRQSFFYGK